MAISYSSLSSKAHRNPFSGPGSFQAKFSKFGPCAWRWSFPIQASLQKCTETKLAALCPSRLHFRGLARVLGDGHFLLKLVFKSAPKPSGHGPFQAPFSRFGPRAWRWQFLIKVCLQKCTQTHLAGPFSRFGQHVWR